MKTLKLNDETIKVSASSERALLILDRYHGAANSSAFSIGSGRYRSQDRVEGIPGLTVEKFWGRDRDPIWVREFAKANPRCSVFFGVTPETYDRFEEVVEALKSHNATKKETRR